MPPQALARIAASQCAFIVESSERTLGGSVSTILLVLLPE
jgi:hypothetical protein